MPTDAEGGWFRRRRPALVAPTDAVDRTPHAPPWPAIEETLRSALQLTQRVDALDEAVTRASQRMLQLMRELDLDQETGLQTRAAFLRGLGRLLPECRPGISHALLHIWVPDLGTIALRHGSSAGIMLASELAHLLHTLLRDGDMVGRLAADEFAAVLIDTTQAVALDRLRSLQRHVAERGFVHVGQAVFCQIRGNAIELDADLTIAGLLDRVAAGTRVQVPQEKLHQS